MKRKAIGKKRRTLAKKPRGDVDAVISVAQIARQKMADSPVTADALGWAYYKLGSDRSAIMQLKEARTKHLANPIYRITLEWLTLRHAARIWPGSGFAKRSPLFPISPMLRGARAAVETVSLPKAPWNKGQNDMLHLCIRQFLYRRSAGAVLVLVIAWGAAPLCAQDPAAATFAPPERNGLEIRNLSASFAYYSSTLPAGAQIGQTSIALPADAAAGGSAQIGWSRSRERSTLSLSYTPSYTGRVRYSSLNALNHALVFNASRKLTPRLTLNFSVTGDYSSVEQFLFATTTLSNVASVPATFEDLAAGLLTARSGNPQLTTILGSAPLVDSPLRPVLYGTRMFTSAMSSSLSYSYSPRLTLTFQGGATRSQHVSENQVSQNSYLLPNSTNGEAGFGLSYSPSPVTRIGADVTTNRMSSPLLELYTTTSVATLGRTIGRHWIIQVHGGVGVTRPVSQTIFSVSTKPHPTGGGNLGFKMLSHTLLGMYERAVGDVYGLGVSSTTTAGGTWRWNRPGRSWWWEATGSRQQLQGGAFGHASGWRSTGSLGRMLGRRLALAMQYAYLSSAAVGTPYSISQSAVRLSLIWAPGPNLF